MSSSTRKGSSKQGRTDTSDQPLSSTRRFSSKRAHNDTQSPSDSPQSLTPSTDDPSTVPLHDEQRQSSKGTKFYHHSYFGKKYIYKYLLIIYFSYKK
jgi:hypothetical protein